MEKTMRNIRCIACTHYYDSGRTQSQCGQIGRVMYYCRHPKVLAEHNKYGRSLNNFVGYGDASVRSPLQFKTRKHFCPMKPQEEKL